MTAASSEDSVHTFGIRELAERTSMPQATLRTWESRYGVPRPSRLPGGHRRYSESDVALVVEILRLRRGGLSLPSAVERATATQETSEPSVFGSVRRRHPELAPRTVTKRSLLALTRAIEDECCTLGERPLLFAAFQHRRFFDQAGERWRELTRTARAAVVFADFGRRQPKVAGLPTRVHLPNDAVLRREWLLVCDAAELPACVVAWELPGQSSVADQERRFEVIWSVDHRVVRTAAAACGELAEQLAPGRGVRVAASGPPVSRPSQDLVRAGALFDRVFAYLDAAGT